MKPLPFLALFAALASTVAAAGANSRTVSAAFMKPTNKWEEFPTRLVADLPGYPSGGRVAFSPYGGLKDAPRRATGFFRAEKVGNRWWLIDPEGSRFIHVGVVSVSLPKAGGRPLPAGMTPESWAAQTVDLLHANGFNGTGAWSDTAALRATAHPVVYTVMTNFMSSYGQKRGGMYQQAGHMGYPHDAIFVFDPQFEAFCDTYAQQLAATKNDPWLLGYFSDNELPLQQKALENFLALPDADPGRKAAEAWLAHRRAGHPEEKGITDEMRDEFLGFVVDRYLALTTAAIRKYDPNHLCLGPRLHGQALRSRALFRACGRHLDVVAINYYHAWSPDAALMRRWAEDAGRPFLITEWYAKGMDSGFANTTGAGWVVKTQADRGRFYQNFTLALLESGVCVGWHWFKYQDNDPTNTKADPSNLDSNKGMVTLAFEPYRPLTEAMREVNTRVYPLIEYFDRTAATR